MRNTMRRALLLAFALAAVWTLAGTPVYADDWDKTTKITVNQPFEIPGHVLPAGTYIMRLVDIASERHVVRFLSEDESKVYATVIGIPDFRLKTTDTSSFTFYETEPANPKPMHAWFYPGHQFGLEFAYPETRAAQIAAVTEEHVVATKEPEFNWTWESEPTVPELLEEPLIAVEPSGQEVELAEVHPEVTPAPEAEPEPAPPVLPKTATPFPLVALLGFMAAGFASGLRLFGR